MKAEELRFDELIRLARASSTSMAKPASTGVWANRIREGMHYLSDD